MKGLRSRYHAIAAAICVLAFGRKPIKEFAAGHHSPSSRAAGGGDAGEESRHRGRSEELLTPPRTKELIVEELTTGDRSGQTMALEALAQVADASANIVGAVSGKLRDPEPAVRAQALATLGSLVGEAELLPIARAACSDESPWVAARALRMLGTFTDEGAFQEILALREGLAADMLPVWAAVIEGRSEVVPGSVLDPLVRDKNPSVRLSALRTLARKPAEIALASRVELVGDPVGQVRAAALEVLKPDLDDLSVRRAVLEGLGDESPWVRRAALELLAQSSPEADRVAALLEDSDSTVRRAAIRAVARIGSGLAVERLLERLADREVLVAREAARELAAIGGERVETALVMNLAHENEQVVIESARGLGWMKSTRAIDGLRDTAARGTPQVQRAVYEALGLVGHRSVVPWLLEQAAKETGYVRASINTALGRIADRQAIAHLLADCHYPDKWSKGLQPSLFTIMSSPPPYPKPDTAVARAAVQALGEIGDPQVVERVAEVAYDVLRDEEFWVAVMRTLSQLGDSRAAPALRQLGVTGQIAQGVKGVELSDAVRCEALRAIARLELHDLVPQILAMDGLRASVTVRRAAVEVLASLTERTYRYRLPTRVSQLFLEDNNTSPDLSASTLPIYEQVQGD